MYLRQQLRAPNDNNGNPRRVWVLFEADTGRGYVRTVATFDEGYAGDPVHQIGTPWADSLELPGVDIPVSEYRRLL